MTERAEVSFTVKESASGTPWIMVESGPDLFGGTVGFDLAPDTKLKKAKKIAEYLGKHISRITLTK